MTERVTLEARVQSKSDLTLVGLGLTTVPFDLAEVSIAGGVSDYAGKTAGFAYGALSIYGSHDLQSGDTRAAVGVSMPLGKRKSLRATSSVDPDGTALGGVYISRAISDRQGDYGYAAEVQRDRAGAIRFSGRGDYLGRYGQLGLELRTGDGATALRAQLDGAVAITGGAMAFGNRVNDSFAIVDVGAAGVPVSVHNRPAAITGRSGKALVTGLQSNHRNRVSVNLDDLPADLALDASGMDVVPGIGAGVRVKFRGDSADSAVVVLTGPNGAPLEAGMVALLNGDSEEFFVGFGGETLVQGLKRNNRLIVQSDTGQCAANFGFTAQTGALQMIEGVRCQ